MLYGIMAMSLAELVQYLFILPNRIELRYPHI
jgi:hypothetical protein